MDPKLITRTQAAQLLQVRPRTLMAWAASNKHLPVVKLGRTVRYRAEDIAAFIRQQTQAPKEAAACS